MAPELSVVICSRNGERTIGATFAALRRQSLNPSRYEVVVVDDGSTDRTSELAASHGARVVTLAPTAGLAAARNAGVSAARGSVVVFTDDDCEPEEEWLAGLASSFSDPALDGVGGRVEAASTAGFLLRYLAARNPLAPLPAELLASTALPYRLRLYLRSVLQAAPDPAPGAQLYSVVGANMAIRRELIIELGGFDEAFTFGAEEEDLCRRAHARPQGVHLRYEPAAVVRHGFEPGLRDSLRRARAYGHGHARAAIKHPDMRLIAYPFPVVVAVAILAALITRRKGTAATGGLAPLAAYARWLTYAMRTRSLEPLLYPYLQLLEETWTMIGEFQGRQAGYTSVPSRRLVARAREIR